MPDKSTIKHNMKKQIVVTRIFNAPLSLVWKTWTDPELVMKWWGPDRFTCPSAKMDVREGGTSVVAMSAPKQMGGQTWFNSWHYTKIIPLELLEYLQNLTDENGNKVNPTTVGMPADFPEDVHTVVTFKDIGNDKTELTITETADFGSISNFAQIGLEQTIDKIVALFK